MKHEIGLRLLLEMHGEAISTKLKMIFFFKYSNMTERLKHRPTKVPEAHFRKLCEYWSWKLVQVRFIIVLLCMFDINI